MSYFPGDYHRPNRYPKTEVLPNLFVGTHDNANKISDPENWTVINVCRYEPHNKDKFKEYVRLSNFETGNYIEDWPTEPIHQHFASTRFIIKESMKQNIPVLVFCGAGVSRSVTIILSYLMKEKRMTFEEARDFLLKKRSIIYPNDGFIKQLKQYCE